MSDVILHITPFPETKHKGRQFAERGKERNLLSSNDLILKGQYEFFYLQYLYRFWVELLTRPACRNAFIFLAYQLSDNQVLCRRFKVQWTEIAALGFP